MTGPSPDAERAPDAGRPTGVPRWVKILGVVALLLLLVLVVLHLAGNSLGGPGSHFGAADPGLRWR